MVRRRISELFDKFMTLSHGAKTVEDQSIYSNLCRFIAQFEEQIDTPSKLENYLKSTIGELRVAVGSAANKITEIEDEDENAVIQTELSSINPIDGSPVSTVDVTPNPEITKQAESANSAKEAWAETTLEQRLQAVSQVRDL